MSRFAHLTRPTGALGGSQRNLTRDEILRYQRILAALGFTNGGRMTPDGVLGTQTSAAVSAYQRARSLSVDGDMGPQTQRALNAEPVAASMGGAPAPGATPANPATPPAAPAPGTPGAPAAPLATVPTPSPLATPAPARSNALPIALAVGGGVLVVGLLVASRKTSKGNAR